MKPRSRAVERSQTGRVSWLYEMIFSGELEPGSSLGETEITELLGVSRSPIRHALRQ